jgi:ABC-type glutathione transport system ATPase component
VDDGTVPVAVGDPTTPVIEVEDLSTHIRLSRSVVQAVGNVSLAVGPGP